jgi:hypothetical protein
MQDNQEALMITYWRKHTGDSYVVRRPKLHAKAWRMWVSIIPVGGLNNLGRLENISNNLKLQQAIKA